MKNAKQIKAELFQAKEKAIDAYDEIDDLLSIVNTLLIELHDGKLNRVQAEENRDKLEEVVCRLYDVENAAAMAQEQIEEHLREATANLMDVPTE